jgi:hypothetical protein
MPGVHLERTASTSPEIRARALKVREPAPIVITRADGTSESVPASSFPARKRARRRRKRRASGSFEGGKR